MKYYIYEVIYEVLTRYGISCLFDLKKMLFK